jgi:SnoaL-like protein
MSRRVQLTLAVLAFAALGFWWWKGGSSAEREVRALFDGFAREFNSGTSDGIGLLARAAQIGEYFTPDVVIELGQGSPPIRGRETVMGMASRLQPRTSAFVLEFDDVNVEFTDPEHGEVTFTVVIRRRSQGSGDESLESLDAREFSGDIVRTGGRWRASRVVAVDTLR